MLNMHINDGLVVYLGTPYSSKNTLGSVDWETGKEKLEEVLSREDRP